MPVHSAFFPLLSQTRAMHQPNLFLCPFTSFLRGHTTFLLLASCLLQHPSKIFFNLLPFFFFPLTVCAYPIVQLPRKKMKSSFQDHIPASAHLLALPARRWLVGALGSPVLSRFGLCWNWQQGWDFHCKLLKVFLLKDFSLGYVLRIIPAWNINKSQKKTNVRYFWSNWVVLS